MDFLYRFDLMLFILYALHRLISISAMTTNAKQLLILAVGVSIFLKNQEAKASQLTFDIAGVSNGSSLDPNYGDRVSSLTDGSFNYGAAGGFTPNVVVDYFTADDQALSLWTTGYSDLTNVAYNEDDFETGFRLVFAADAGYLAVLEGFDLGNFGAGSILPGFQILDGGSNVLYQESNVALPTSSGSALNVILPAGLQSSELTLQFDLTGLGGGSDNIGIDNVVFSQVAIPEPSSSLLLLLSSVCLLTCRKRSLTAA